MIKRFIIIGVVFGLLIGGLAFFHFVFLPKMIEQAIRGAPPRTETVSAEKVRAENWAPYVKAIGTVQAVNGIEVPAKTSGTVRKYFFESGADVKEGDPLVQIDDDSEQADLRSFQAQLKNAEQELERIRGLAKQGIAPRKDLQAAEARQADLAAQIDKVQVVIKDKLIRAPWAGRLGIRKVDVGSYVQPGQTLVWLQSVDPVYVDFTVPENEVARLKVGQALETSFSGYPQAIFNGKIDVIDPRINETTRVIAVRGVLPNPEGHILPGMFADVRVIVDAPQPVLTVARTAVTYSLYGDSVYVVVPAKSQPAAPAQNGGQAAQQSAEPALQVERRFVKAGEVRGDRASVSQGLKEGEQVVTVGQLKLRPGTNIRIDNSVALNRPVGTGTE
jgi:membrane fusion protein (multidrug efflux system)